MLEIISQNITTILAVLTTVSAFFLGKRKQNAETKTAEGDALKKMQENYATFVNDMETQYKSLKTDFERKSQYWELKYQKLENEFHECKKKLLS